jgi:hypothetical protein
MDFEGEINLPKELIRFEKTSGILSVISCQFLSFKLLASSLALRELCQLLTKLPVAEKTLLVNQKLKQSKKKV